MLPPQLEVPRLGVKSELQLLAYAPATAISDPPDLSFIFELHCNSWRHQILNPLSGARNRTCGIMDQLDLLLLSHNRDSTLVLFLPLLTNTVMFFNFLVLSIFFFFWLHLQHVEVPRPEPQLQHQILDLLHHKRGSCLFNFRDWSLSSYSTQTIFVWVYIQRKKKSQYEDAFTN